MKYQKKLWTSLLAGLLLSGCSSHIIDGYNPHMTQKMEAPQSSSVEELFKRIINETNDENSDFRLTHLVKDNNEYIFSLEYNQEIKINNEDEVLEKHSFFEKESVDLLCNSKSFKNLVKENSSNVSIEILDENSDPFMIETLESCNN